MKSIRMQTGEFSQKITETLNKHISSFIKMIRTLNEMISIKKEIIGLVNNFTINNYDNLKYMLKLYDEKYNEIFYNNSNRYIKDDIKKIFDIIQQYKNYELNIFFKNKRLQKKLILLLNIERLTMMN